MKGPAIYCRSDGTKPLAWFEKRRYPENPNQHPPEQIEKLVDVIKKNGWRQAIIISDLTGRITKGHGRLDAAQLGKFAEAPYEMQHYDNEEQELADVIADNQLFELGETDDKRYASALKELKKSGGDLRAAAFDESEYADLLKQLRTETGDGGRGKDRGPGKQVEGRHTIILHYTMAEHEEFERLEKEARKQFDLLSASDVMLRLLETAAKKK